MQRLLILLAPLALLLTACPAGTDDDDSSCDSYIWEFTCENGSCTCDDDGAACTDPDETTSDDANSCDNVCIECAD